MLGLLVTDIIIIIRIFTPTPAPQKKRKYNK